MGEEVVDQILAVKCIPRSNAMFEIADRVLGCVDRRYALSGRLLDRGEHIQHPLLPCIVLAHGLEQTVVVVLAADDVAAHVEGRRVELSGEGEIENVYKAS